MSFAIAWSGEIKGDKLWKFGEIIDMSMGYGVHRGGLAYSVDTWIGRGIDGKKRVTAPGRGQVCLGRVYLPKWRPIGGSDFAKLFERRNTTFEEELIGQSDLCVGEFVEIFPTISEIG